MKTLILKKWRISLEVPSSVAARLDLISNWGTADDARLRLLWAVLGLCWKHPTRKLPKYRPERGDRDLFAYAAKVMEVMVNDWKISPYEKVELLDEEGNGVELLRNSDQTIMPLSLSNVGILMVQEIQMSIPLPEEVEEETNFTSPKGDG